MKEPIRLCEGDQLPSALRDAFRALEQDAPSADTVLRVQRALQALPAGSAGAAVATTFGATKLWLVTSLIAGVTTLGVVMHGRQAAPRAELEQSGGATQVVPVTASQDAPAATREPDAVAADAPSEPATRARGSHEVSTPLAAKGGDLEASPRARSLTSSKQTRFVAATQRTSVAAARSAQVGRALTVSAPESHENAEAQEPAPPPADTPQPRASTSEAALLAQARRLSTSDPVAALGQVEALAQRFPDGTFTQERELLAIQLHQRLGHTDQVAQLVRRFRERFPNSVYRRALPP